MLSYHDSETSRLSKVIIVADNPHIAQTANITDYVRRSLHTPHIVYMAVYVPPKWYTWPSMKLTYCVYLAFYISHRLCTQQPTYSENCVHKNIPVSCCIWQLTDTTAKCVYNSLYIIANLYTWYAIFSTNTMNDHFQNLRYYWNLNNLDLNYTHNTV